MLTLRHLVDESDGLYAARENEHALLRYYANSIAHLMPPAEGAPPAALSLSAVVAEAR